MIILQMQLQVVWSLVFLGMKILLNFLGRGGQMNCL